MAIHCKVCGAYINLMGDHDLCKACFNIYWQEIKEGKFPPGLKVNMERWQHFANEGGLMPPELDISTWIELRHIGKDALAQKWSEERIAAAIKKVVDRRNNNLRMMEMIQSANAHSNSSETRQKNVKSWRLY